MVTLPEVNPVPPPPLRDASYVPDEEDLGSLMWVLVATAARLGYALLEALQALT